MPDQDSIIALMIPQRRAHCAMGWLALIVLLLNASHVDAQNAPLQKLREQFERISLHTDYFDAIASNSSSIASNIGLYVSSDVPSKALDIKNWSRDDAVPMAADLPLFWNPSTRQFQIRSDQLAVASDAKIYFTWNFLLAYETLAPDLRQSGSALAIGMAALVASEHIYRTNWAYLPEELHDAAAFVYLLSLSNASGVNDNDLIKQTHTSSSNAQFTALVMRLLHDACPAELATDSVLRQITHDAMFI
ncbi:MAG TPA: hypothetical protein VFF39_10410, partial [Verrucomicrobiae bacterium]|nr:hypothetical protein [Verrucomicrobiae bacterium]